MRVAAIYITEKETMLILEQTYRSQQELRP